MYENRSISDKILLVLKGIAMGAANKVPGVSGGVVAFVAGFYEEFIYSLQKINSKAFKLLLFGRFKSFYRYINGSFLSLLILGMVISFFSVSKLIDYFLVTQELYVWSLFFGMILGSIYYINKEFQQWNTQTRTVLILGIIIGLSLSIPDPLPENRNYFFVFICGMISVSGMTLPGLSGSFIMMILGNYVLLLVDSVNALYDTFVEIIAGDLSFIRNSERIELLIILALFTFGSVVGLVSLSHFLGYILNHYKAITYAAIIGFISGSLGVVWPWKTDLKNAHNDIIGYERYFPQLLEKETFFAILFIIVGIAIVIGLERYGKKQTFT
jgi:putative membrane protein